MAQSIGLARSGDERRHQCAELSRATRVACRLWNRRNATNVALERDRAGIRTVDAGIPESAAGDPHEAFRANEGGGIGRYPTGESRNAEAKPGVGRILCVSSTCRQRDDHEDGDKAVA